MPYRAPPSKRRGLKQFICLVLLLVMLMSLLTVSALADEARPGDGEMVVTECGEAADVLAVSADGAQYLRLSANQLGEPAGESGVLCVLPPGVTGTAVYCYCPKTDDLTIMDVSEGDLEIGTYYAAFETAQASGEAAVWTATNQVMARPGLGDAILPGVAGVLYSEEDVQASQANGPRAEVAITDDGTDNCSSAGLRAAASLVPTNSIMMGDALLQGAGAGGGGPGSV